MKRRLIRWSAALVIIYIGIHVTLYFGQEILLFHPQKLSENHIFTFDAKFEEVWLTSEDGTRLNAVHFHAENPKGVVLYIHGNGGSVANAGMVHNDFLPLGYDLFVMDWRGYGKSEGEVSQEGMIQDAIAAYEHLKTQFPADKIIAYGRSMGTGMAMRLAAEKQVRGLILETPYASLKQLASERFPWVWIDPIMRYPFESYQLGDKISAPTLIFHGTADETIPYDHAKQLKTALGGLSKLITLPKGNHNNLNSYSAYHIALKQFLGQLPRLSR